MKYIYLELLEVVYCITSLWNLKNKSKRYIKLENYLIEEERLVKYGD